MLLPDRSVGMPKRIAPPRRHSACTVGSNTGRIGGQVPMVAAGALTGDLYPTESSFRNLPARVILTFLADLFQNPVILFRPPGSHHAGCGFSAPRFPAGRRTREFLGA